MLVSLQPFEELLRFYACEILMVLIVLDESSASYCPLFLYWSLQIDQIVLAIVICWLLSDYPNMIALKQMYHANYGLYVI